MRNRIIQEILPFVICCSLMLTRMAGLNVSKTTAEAAEYGLNNPEYNISTDSATWDCIYFGEYWQNDTNGDGDADREDAKEPIKWRVLSVDGDDAFLLADKILDSQKYDDEDNDYWGNCTLRLWLNRFFYNTAFSENEKDAIKVTDVVNNDADLYKDDDEYDNSKDKLFLLSSSELKKNKYGFSEDNNGLTRLAYYSDYSYDESYADGKKGPWWTRGFIWTADTRYKFYVNNSSGAEGNTPVFYRYGVRPALHINLLSSCRSYAGKVTSSDLNEDENETMSDVSYNTSSDGVCAEKSIAAILTDPVYKEYFDSRNYFSNESKNDVSVDMIIPGLKQTNQTEGDQKDACHAAVPQGVCATNDYVLISAYCHNLATKNGKIIDTSEGEGVRHRSVIYVMDKKTKKYITTIRLKVEDDAGLKEGNHVGGLAFGNNTVYIAGSGDEKVWKLSYEEVKKAVSSKKDVYTVTIPKNDCINTINASFIFWDGELFVGNFDDKDASKNYMYSYDTKTGSPTSSEISLPKRTQGVSFGVSGKGRYCICSISFGRKSHSEMYAAELVKTKKAGGYTLKNWHKINTPNMSEDIQVDNGVIFNCFESAANFYNNGGDSEKPFDRISRIGVRKLISNIMKKQAVTIQSSKLLKNSASEDESDEDTYNIISEGPCGENVSYCLYQDGELVLSGQGSMENYTEDSVPWSEYRDKIISVYIDCEVSGIGEYSFYNCPNLAEVTVSDYMKPDLTLAVGYKAFDSCPLLARVSMPDNSFDIDGNAFDQSASIQFSSDSDDVKKYVESTANAALHQHNLQYKETVKATCMENGYDLYQCDCGYEEVDNVVPATGEHDYIEAERSEATETEEGFIRYQCKNCIQTYVQTLEYAEPEEKPQATATPQPPQATETPAPDDSASDDSGSSQSSVTGNESYQSQKKPSVSKPGKVSGVKAKNKKKKKMAVSWKRKTGVSGYQIQYAQNKKFTKKKKTKNVAKYKSSATIKGLKKGKKYYVRVRAYKKGGGKKAYGKWSNVKKVKIKK